MAEKKEKGKGGGLKIVVIILGVIVAIGLGFGGAYFYLSKKAGSATENVNHNVTAAAFPNQTMPNVASELSTATFSMDEFLVNLADDGGKRFFKVKLFIGYEPVKKKEEDMKKELEEKKPIVRDAVNSILRSKKSSDLSTQKNIDDLKKEILTKIIPYFINGRVNNIYFNDILLQ
jgi:flagellar basal body-associated protein FliL